MKSWICTPLLALVLATLAPGCASVGQRIRENQKAYDGLPATDQEKIRAGEIAAGFTPDEVRLAKGEPSANHVHWKDDQELMTWTYTERTLMPAPNAPGADSLAAPYGFPEPGPKPIQAQPTIYDERTVLVVNFVDGRVADWH